jgi:hypothetical protein
MTGNSATHGPHQLAKKLTTTNFFSFKTSERTYVSLSVDVNEKS